MTNDNGNDKRKVVGTLTVMLAALVALTGMAACVAVGSAFGASWGWVALTVLLVAACVIVSSAIHRVASEERDDG